jgi:hypothetical protein
MSATRGKLTPAQQRERAVISVLFKIGIGLVVFGIIVTLLLIVIVPSFRSTLPTKSSSFGASATYHYPGIDPSKMQPLSSVNQDLLKVAIITPQNMQTGQTFPVTVLLFADTGENAQAYNFFAEQNNLTGPTYAYSFYTLQLQPPGTGSADNSLGGYFGKKYTSVAAANLIAPYSSSSGSSLTDTSSALPSGQQQSLDTYGIMWEWNITPQEAGQQILSVNITATWSPQTSTSATPTATPTTPTPTATSTPTDTETRQLLLTSIPVQVKTPLVYPSLQELFTGISTGLTTTGTALVSTTTLAMLFSWIVRGIPPWQQGDNTTPTGPPSGAEIPSKDTAKKEEAMVGASRRPSAAEQTADEVSFP